MSILVDIILVDRHFCRWAFKQGIHLVDGHFGRGSFSRWAFWQRVIQQIGILVEGLLVDGHFGRGSFCRWAFWQRVIQQMGIFVQSHLVDWHFFYLKNRLRRSRTPRYGLRRSWSPGAVCSAYGLRQFLLYSNIQWSSWGRKIPDAKLIYSY